MRYYKYQMDTNASVANDVPEEEQPKKYIRTFESDMATLQKGGVPDLAPRKPTPSGQCRSDSSG